MDKLTPQLNEVQLKQNIDALQKGGMQNDKVQAYVNNYTRDKSGNYVLKQQAQPSMGTRMGTDIQNTGVDVNNAISGQGKYAGDNPVTRGFEAASSAVSGVGQVASEVLPSSVRGAIGKVGEAAGGIVNWLGDKLGNTKLAQDFVTQHPDAAKTLEQLAKTGASAGNIAGNILATDAGVKGAQAGVDAIAGTKPSITVGGKTLTLDDIHSDVGLKHFKELSPADQQAVTNFDHLQSAKQMIDNAVKTGKDTTELQAMYDEMKQAIKTPEGSTAKMNEGGTGLIGQAKDAISKIGTDTTEEKAANLQSLKEKITPKPTVKEAKLAMDQGRLIAPTEGGILTKGEPSKVLTSDQQLKSIQTIDRLIPDHANLSEPELYTELKNKIGETAQKLKPEMEKVPIKPETVKQITDEWTKVKADQKGNAYTPADVNVKKLQADFENRLKTAKSGNMNDIWEARQAYDDSVPDNVKKATSQSSESLQSKKEMWLQNRRILTNAINDTKNGLGETSRGAFSDMTDMYEGKNGILSKAKIETKGAPSKLSQTLQKHPIIKAGVRAAGLGAGLHLIP